MQSSHVLPALFLLAGLSGASAQTAVTPLPPDPVGEILQRPIILQSSPSQSGRIADVVQEVRVATVALRQACAKLPNVTYAPESAGPPVPAIRQPYAAEEDSCAMVMDPSHFMEGYAWPFGLMGGGITLLGLGFFTLVGGVLRLVWHGPLNRYRHRYWRNI